MDGRELSDKLSDHVEFRLGCVIGVVLLINYSGEE